MELNLQEENLTYFKNKVLPALIKEAYEFQAQKRFWRDLVRDNKVSTWKSGKTGEYRYTTGWPNSEFVSDILTIDDLQDDLNNLWKADSNDNSLLNNIKTLLIQ